MAILNPCLIFVGKWVRLKCNQFQIKCCSNYCYTQVLVKQFIYFKQKDAHFIMKSWVTTCLVTASIILSAACHDIVDFSFTQYDQNQGKPPRPVETISIKPNREIIQGYFFPQACYLAKKLEQERSEDSRELANYDMDTVIDSIKTDFTQLLKVSQKIKKKKLNIEELSEMSGRTTNVTVVQPKEIDSLRQQESKLEGINKQISNLTEELQNLVKDSMRNSGGNEFAISSVNFEIESLRLKLDYLKNLKKNSNDIEAAKVKDQYNRYFNELRAKFDDQNRLIDDLNTILRNENEIGTLKAKILSLRGKIDLANLMIEQKEVCAKERDEIKKFQKNDYEIKSHMANLREKKKDINNIKNKYCEGVAKKLEDRVKKVLLSYDYTFECAEGLEDKRRQRDEDKLQLERAEARLRYLESSAGIDDYKRRFDENRQFIKAKQQQLSRFSIPDYYHDVGELNRLISKAEVDLEDATQRKKSLSSPSNNKVVDYRRIQELVGSIKKLKGTYCHEYEKYERQAHEIWKQVQKYESEVEYTSKIRGIYEQEINELRDLEILFDSLRNKILRRIE